MRLAITSDGTSVGTSIFNQETSEKLGLVQKMVFRASSNDGAPMTKVSLDILNVPVSFNGMAEITQWIPDEKRRMVSKHISKENVRIVCEPDKNGLMKTQVFKTETGERLSWVESVKFEISVPAKLPTQEELSLIREDNSFDWELWNELIANKTIIEPPQ